MQGLSEKYYLSLRGWRFFQTTARRLDLAVAYYPEVTFAPATKMTTDAVLNDGMGTLAYVWRGGRKRKSVENGATRHREKLKDNTTIIGKALLSCRRDGSPTTVIVMLAWLVVAGVPPATFVFKWSCLSLPCLAKTGARRFEDKRDIAAGNSRRCRFTLAVSCIRWHFGCQPKTKK